MATPLRRLVALGPAGCIWPGCPQDLRYGNNRRWLRESGTKWVRLWADWPSLEPANGQYDLNRWYALDAQIAAAHADGLKVILTPYRFPTWANGTESMTAEQLAATTPDRKFPSDPESKAKSLLFRPPADVSETSQWGRFMKRIVDRWSPSSPYRPSATTFVDVIEVCNEPNHQWWPQQAPSTTTDPYAQSTISVHDVVARMFVTAQKLSKRHAVTPLLAGPGSADGVDSNRMRTGYHSFGERLLTRLKELGFTGGANWVWTHHNYSDVAAGNGARTADMRRRLVNRWAGWPSGNAADPQVWITEGGVTLSKIQSTYAITDPVAKKAKQAELVQRNWDVMLNGTEGAGVAMTCQYLLHTDPAYDSGVCETPETGGATRPAYATWKSLPSWQ
jgi:hypothetical protein